MHAAHLALLEICRVSRPPMPVSPMQIQLARRFADWFINVSGRTADAQAQELMCADIIKDLDQKHKLHYEDEGTLADHECSETLNLCLGFGTTVKDTTKWLDELDARWLERVHELEPARALTTGLGGFQLITAARTPALDHLDPESKLGRWVSDMPPCPDALQHTRSFAASYTFPWTQHARKRAVKASRSTSFTMLLDRQVISPCHVMCRSTNTQLHAIASSDGTCMLTCSQYVGDYNDTWKAACAMAQMSGASVSRPQTENARMSVCLASPGLVFDPARLQSFLEAFGDDYGLRLQQHASPNPRIGMNKRVLVLTDTDSVQKEHSSAVSAAACHYSSATFYGNFYLLPHRSTNAWAASLNHSLLRVLPWVTQYSSYVGAHELIL